MLSSFAMASSEAETAAQAPPPPTPADGNASETAAGAVSKKQAKKLAKKEAKEDRKQQSAAAAAAASQADAAEADPFAGNYGDVLVEDIQSKAISGREWTEIGALGADLACRVVLIRGVAQTIRPVSKKMAFVVLRQFMSTVQCVLTVDKEFVSPHMVKFATGLSKESIVDVEGMISIPKDPIKGTTQQVRKLYCINRSVPNLPINIEDAARSETEFERAELLDYKGQPACLAQSPQLHKQMVICGGFGRVFEVGSVFRAEDSYTHRHLCEFVGLDVEMEIKEHYFEHFYFYILCRYPLAVRPFYTMPCYDDPAYSNSFDVFIRVAAVTEVADNDVVGEGSFRGVRRWQGKLRSSPSMVEGATHRSSGGGRKLRKKARPSDPSVSDRGNLGLLCL
ncbi:hypothetical protein BHM03_00021104 [Ensete ventricosum]|nr:hypothetical protein BHM03_00021104 [Ensete ventricosum]